MTLVRSRHHDEDIESLRSKLTSLEAALGERDVEIARARAALEKFRLRYRQEVGRLHEELDDLLASIAEAELAEKSKRPRDDSGGPRQASSGPRPEPLPRFTSDAVRKLFRDVARTIHPDLADDEDGRDRRHALMVEANRAYALGDEERLRWILEAWESRPEAVQGSDAEAMKERLGRRIAQLEGQLTIQAADLAAVKESPLWQLKVMVDEAAGRGRNLMAEMVGRLKRDILVARNRLDAIQWTP